uniref:Polycomb group RING finger protein 3 n=1 Tax=Ascaris suum TaxID=6253 RepID=F1LA89_ASCSU
MCLGLRVWWPMTRRPVQVGDEYKILLRTLNPHITCPICKGYFIEATTVIECLHTFCKSCLLKHFENESNCCPKCSGLIHQSHPSHYVSFDRTMQELVYKLVPGLQAREEEYRNAFAKLCKKEHVDGDSVVKTEEVERTSLVSGCYVNACKE